MSRQHGDKTIERLKSYLMEREGDVMLSDKEDDLLKKVLMANDLFQSRQYGTFQISRILSKCFSCSIAAAKMIMTDAQIIFGARNIYDRSYMTALHLDEIIEDMVAARERGDYSMLMDLHKVKNKAIELLPLQGAGKGSTPAVINYNIFSSNIQKPVMDVSDALKAGRQLLLSDEYNQEEEEIQPLTDDNEGVLP